MSGALALFFARGHLIQGLDARRERLLREIEKAPAEHVLQADDVEWARALVERYRVEAPVLKPGEVTIEEPREVQIDLTWEENRRLRRPSVYVPAYRMAVHIPFAGDKDIFDFLPSSHILEELRAVVSDGELVLYVQYPEDRPVDIRAHTNEFIRRVETNLVFAREDIARFNSSLHNDTLAAIEARRRNIEEHRAGLAATGFPIVPPRDPKREIVLIRRPAPPLPSTSPGQPLELEPVLANDVYEHILYVIRQHSRSMERNPGAYASMAEEDRRHVILDLLNSHYPGTGTAETFSYRGHTDIRLDHEGRSLFVAECKFWKGARRFTATVDQLLGYKTWRDSKLAVLMFVRELDLTKLLERGRAALEAHPQFVEWQESEGETEFRVTVSHPGDVRRRAVLTVLFISTPTPSRRRARPAS
jgi:hypothetical protein